MTNRTRGDYHERQTKARLMTREWLVVRSAGSLGVADLVALRSDRRPWLVSCKINGYMRPVELRALWAAASWAGADPIIASRPKPGLIRFQLLLTAPTPNTKPDLTEAVP
jgi:Holliday junction resolvase